MSPLQVAELLIQVSALRLDFDRGFRWVSGVQSPIYCDNRRLMSAVEGRKKIATALAEKIRLEFPDVELVVGTATAGIPHAAWVSDLLALPMLYVRSEAKSHGTQSRIEGGFEPGQSCVLIEDLISTGKSSLAAAQTLREEGLKLSKVYSIFSYQLVRAENLFAQASLSYESLCGVSDLIAFARREGSMDAVQEQKLKQFFVELDG